VTWNPSHFADTSIKVQVLAQYENSTGHVSGPFEQAGKGFWAWEIPKDILRQSGVTSLSVTLSILAENLDTEQQNDAVPFVGPTVFIVDREAPLRGGPGPSRNLVAIIVPVVIVAVVLLFAGLCFWSWRRHGTVPVVGAISSKMRRRSGGYGVRKSQAERVGARGGAAGVGSGSFGIRSDKPAPNINIQLTDRESWSPTGTGNTRNVFREEVQRQERQR